ncbi:DUF2577 domain-containing protein [Paenibacillus pinisoli]|uniref:DUF2577 domain-containing protein n=1 Tax=Paenibacillus pinisoli TaxID=1276110 RepID=A0A3A6Q4S1_9BACL|nr:DUF2577 domain-containing protein [Paenibacillus pinisoli]RJX40864.1 DUF2577 domain-containing protein [Paenibacillus pinisoli]
MADLLSLIKQAAAGAVDATSPAAVMFGLITDDNPLEVNVDQRFSLPADFLIVPESLTRLELPLYHTHQYTDTSDSGPATKTTSAALPEEPVVIRRGLKKGDKVVLLRVQGGQQYLILDRMVSGNDT